MLAGLSRTLFTRIYGFGVPAASADGTVVYGCQHCNAVAEHEPLPHAADCPAWGVLDAFERVSRRLATIR